jgi:creatinine amidohydrolase
LLDNVCREIARNGLTKIVLVNAHGGNYHLIRFFAQSQLASRRDYVVYVIDPGMLPEDKAAVTAQWESTYDGHAGESETSQILTVRPDSAKLDAVPSNPEGMPLERLKNLRDAGVYTGIWWYADHPTHYAGDARPATAPKGERELDAHARHLAVAIRAIKQDQESQRLQDEFYATAERHK